MSGVLRVLIVDDSALMRRQLRMLLEEAGGFEVHLARNGEDALERVGVLKPDVVTLDINMPVMDGLTCLAHLMDRPDSPPVVMVSSLTEKGAMATFEALELGAVDFLCKPDGTVSHNLEAAADEIVAKVRTAAVVRPRPPTPLSIHRGTFSRRSPLSAPQSVSIPPVRDASFPIVLIGVSTGGPRALDALLAELPPSFPAAVVIAQHMPKSFTRVLSERLNDVCALTVQEADRTAPVSPGHVLIAQGNTDLFLRTRLGRLVAVPGEMDPESPWHPSVTHLVRSATEAVDDPSRLIAVQLTGMGNDGVEAIGRLHELGGTVIAESRETAVIYGMPREVIEQGFADYELPLDQIPRALAKLVGRR